MNDFDKLLIAVRKEAQKINIPVSDKISSHVVVNSRAKTRFGQCKMSGGCYVIELSSRLLDAPEISCRQTIAHELIHTCAGCMNHGDKFKYYAAKMNRAYGYNISRTNSAEEMGVGNCTKDAKYIIVCKKCGKEIPRSRKSPLTDHPEYYKCKCGGELYLKGGRNNSSAVSAGNCVKYVILCTRCGKRYERERMSAVIKTPSRYRCTCGGTLKRIR